MTEGETRETTIRLKQAPKIETILIGGAVVGVAAAGLMLASAFMGIAKQLDPREQGKAASDREGMDARKKARAKGEKMRAAIAAGDRDNAYKWYVQARGDLMVAHQRFVEAERQQSAKDDLKVEMDALVADFTAAYPELVDRANKEAKEWQQSKTVKPSWLPIPTPGPRPVSKPPKAKKARTSGVSTWGDDEISGPFDWLVKKEHEAAEAVHKVQLVPPPFPWSSAKHKAAWAEQERRRIEATRSLVEQERRAVKSLPRVPRLSWWGDDEIVWGATQAATGKVPGGYRLAVYEPGQKPPAIIKIDEQTFEWLMGHTPVAVVPMALALTKLQRTRQVSVREMTRHEGKWKWLERKRWVVFRDGRITEHETNAIFDGLSIQGPEPLSLEGPVDPTRYIMPMQKAIAAKNAEAAYQTFVLSLVDLQLALVEYREAKNMDAADRAERAIVAVRKTFVKAYPTRYAAALKDAEKETGKQYLLSLPAVERGAIRARTSGPRISAWGGDEIVWGATPATTGRRGGGGRGGHRGRGGRGGRGWGPSVFIERDTYDEDYPGCPPGYRWARGRDGRPICVPIRGTGHSRTNAVMMGVQNWGGDEIVFGSPRGSSRPAATTGSRAQRPQPAPPAGHQSRPPARTGAFAPIGPGRPSSPITTRQASLPRPQLSYDPTATAPPASAMQPIAPPSSSRMEESTLDQDVEETDEEEQEFAELEGEIDVDVTGAETVEET